ncbi:branched-chain amino acid ABC transporter permease/ATP-binding protein [Subtercola frigoramans]|uniref:Sulfate-transporting ATPase n=1 Tax=Subtercola frigoramans TaxID=120298 RepID=A0ABS2L117_9MICO|nr:branched-chain amino acid ABC transporter permease/ATP-binding protein [Subtercola frigoramans]MBM7470768.1 sulfate-transporting ATPase [Subtercola frigoramans]
MDDFLKFALLGIGIGAIYGLTAQGLVLIFLSSRVLNFSQGAIALVAAYAYSEATRAGAPLGVAALAALLIAGALGAVIELTVMRPLRHASTITRLVATIAVLTVIQSVAALYYGDATQFVGGLLPTTPLRLSGTLLIGTDRAIVLAIGILVTIALTWYVRRTRLGLATLGTAENPVAVEVLGWSSRRVSLVNWVMGATLAGLAGVLIAPMNGISVTGMGQIVYCALAAALIGGFRSFGWAMGGGLVLGVAQAEAVRIHGDVGWSTAIPFIVIVAAILIRGDVIRGRGGRREQLPAVGTGKVKPLLVLVCVVLVGGLSLLLGHSALDAFSTSLIIALIGLSFVVATGYAGELSLAQYALAGIGALVAAKAAADFGVPFVVALLIGALSGLISGTIVGILSLRVRGDVVAIISVGLALALQALVLENPSLTGGISGISVPSPSLFGISVDAVQYPERFALVCAAVLVVCSLVVANIRRGASGRRMLATRSGERAALSLGISTRGARLYGLAVAGALAGTAGALLAFRQPTVVFSGFTVDASMTLLGAVVLGGVGYLAAGVLGGFAVTGGFVYYLMSLSGLQQFLPLILGLALLVNLVTVPDGAIPANARLLAVLTRRLRPISPSPRTRRPSGRNTVLPPAIAAHESSARPGETLTLAGLSVEFGGIRALHDVSMTIEPGRVEGLIGPNGAGKTTLIDAVTGITRGYTGRISLGAAAIDRLSPAERARKGLGRTLQGLELFEELTVRENLIVGSDARAWRAYATDLVHPGRATMSSAALDAVERFGLTDDLDVLPGALPYGRRRLVAIARSIAARPSVLLLDEPAAGLSATERVELGELIREMADSWKIAVLLVEHDVDLVMRICDHITVLEYGKVIAHGVPEVVRENDEVRRAFLGQEATV